MKKNNKLNSSSSQRDYKQYLFAYSYNPNETKFFTPTAYNVSAQTSTPANIVCDLEMIFDLPNYKIRSCIECCVSKDEDGSFLIECPSLNLYSSGESRLEAVENIKDNIESLYDDLMESDDFSDDWLEIKKILIKKIVK